MLTTRILSALALVATFLTAAAAPRPADEPVLPIPAGSEGALVSSSTGALAARETAGPDTFVLYGGPDHPTEGKFQLADAQTADWGDGTGLPGGYGGGPGAWTPVDLTKEPLYWHRSTFNAANLNDNGAGNHAMWCGVTADDPRASEWIAAPGYGNSWYEEMLYESPPLADPSVGQEVALEFFFNVEVSDLTWDWFQVEYDSAGTWVRVLFEPDVDFVGVGPAVPGDRFTDHQDRPIVYTGNDYGGVDGDRIRMRLLVTSDGAWSDEDGFGPTDAGLVQVDDITLTTSQGSFSEDFESTGPWLFEPVQGVFAGDFADVHRRMTDLDPCRENVTPVAGFMDYGQVVRNGPGVNGRTSTGGSTSPGVNYGIGGNWGVQLHRGVVAGS